MQPFATITAQLPATADIARFPYEDGRVCLIRYAVDGTVTHASRPAAKRALLARTGDTDLLLATWPGIQGNALFVVDDRPAAEAALAPSTLPAVA